MDALLFALLYGASLWIPGLCCGSRPCSRPWAWPCCWYGSWNASGRCLSGCSSSDRWPHLGRSGIYLYHVIFMSTGPGHGLVPRFPTVLLASLAFAVVSYEFLERRVLRYKDRFR